MIKEIDLAALAAPFPEKCIDWRIAQAGLKGDGLPWGKVLAYVDARAVQNRLDEVCGIGGWKVEYHVVTGGFMCALSIRIEGDWVTKWDGSDETDVEPFKGGISKSLVRAASVWGIGRYLYDLGTSWADFNEVSRNTRGAREAEIIVDKQTKKKESHYWLPPELPNWALPKNEQRKEPPVAPPSGKKTVPPKEDVDPDRMKVQTAMLKAHREFMAKFPQVKVPLLLQSKYGKQESRLLTTDELSDFVQYMESAVQEVK